jgi:hypothetical protein
MAVSDVYFFVLTTEPVEIPENTFTSHYFNFSYYSFPSSASIFPTTFPIFAFASESGPDDTSAIAPTISATILSSANFQAAPDSQYNADQVHLTCNDTVSN